MKEASATLMGKEGEKKGDSCSRSNGLACDVLGEKRQSR